MRSMLSRLANRGSDIAEIIGLAGVSASVAGLTANPWWGVLAGSISTLVWSIAGSRPPGGGG